LAFVIKSKALLEAQKVHVEDERCDEYTNRRFMILPTEETLWLAVFY
jgi:hypothetical protein